MIIVIICVGLQVLLEPTQLRFKTSEFSKKKVVPWILIISGTYSCTYNSVICLHILTVLAQSTITILRQDCLSKLLFYVVESVLVCTKHLKGTQAQEKYILIFAHSSQERTKNLLPLTHHAAQKSWP